MGLIGYYKRLVEHFSLIAALLSRLNRKGMKYEWDKMCEQNFQELKSNLVLPTIGIGYVVLSDAAR